MLHRPASLSIHTDGAVVALVSCCCLFVITLYPLGPPQRCVPQALRLAQADAIYDGGMI